MPTSILTSIKKLLGITAEYTDFDADIIMHINSVFSILKQLGVGPKEGFSITGDSETWTDFLPGQNIDMVKSYIYLKVRLMFDPPINSSLIESINRQIAELEWRLNVEIEPYRKEEDGDDI